VAVVSALGGEPDTQYRSADAASPDENEPTDDGDEGTTTAADFGTHSAQPAAHGHIEPHITA